LRSTANLSEYDKIVIDQCNKYGGFYNAHAHLDRAYTLADTYLEHTGTTPLKASNLPLMVKQNLVGDLHKGPAYAPADMEKRMRLALNRQLAFNVKRIDTNIDATPDLPENGLMAANIALKLKKEFLKKGLHVNIAPTPIFGFKEGTQRWEVFEAAARMCDYLSLLPEKDDYARGGDPDGKVGFKHHVRMGLELARELKKEIQFHVDQMDVPFEEGALRVLEVLESQYQPDLSRDDPMTWLIHVISPSAYSEQRFRCLVDKLLEHNVGVIICPTAALTMRQLRATVSLDVFNIGNASTVLQREAVQNLAAAPRVVEILAPRLARLGVRFAF